MVDPSGRVFFATAGKSYVIQAGPVFKVLATNKLDQDKTLSSFAVSNNQLFLRTATHLYCIGKK